MKFTQITRRAAVVAAVAALAACGGSGGGGDDSAGGGGDGGGTTPGTPTPVAVTGQYRLLTAAADFTSSLAAMNAQGAQGYAFLSPMGPNASTVFGDFYVTDTAHAASKFDYVALPDAASADAALAQMNAQGAKGYAYKSGMAFGSITDLRSLYVKDTSRSMSYSYERLPTSAATTRTAYESQLNAEGAKGFRSVGPLFVGGDMFNLYGKDSSSATYTYTLRTATGQFGVANGAALQQQVNELGAQGYLYLGANVLGSETVMIYEKSSTQNGAVEYSVDQSTETSLNQLLAQLNERAAKGYFFFSDIVANDNKIYTISVKNAAALRNPLAGIAFP